MGVLNQKAAGLIPWEEIEGLKGFSVFRVLDDRQWPRWGLGDLIVCDAERPLVDLVGVDVVATLDGGRLALGLLAADGDGYRLEDVDGRPLCGGLQLGRAWMVYGCARSQEPRLLHGAN